MIVSCAIRAYAIQNAMFDIWLMLGFRVVGYVFKKIGTPWRRSRWRSCSVSAPRTPYACRWPAPVATLPDRSCVGGPNTKRFRF